MYPKISIITVVRNDYRGLGVTIDNLEQLPYDNKEIIVVDGASTDGTVDVAAAHMHSIAYFVSEPDGGIYDAMNKGLRAATGQYVWFVNAGDRVVDFDSVFKWFVSETPLADIYYGDTQVVNGDGVLLGRRRKPLPAVLTVRSLRCGMVVCHQSFIVRRQIAPLYDLQYRYSADFAWMIDCVRSAHYICNVGAVVSEFSLGGATTAHHRDSLVERWHIMRRTFGLFSTICSHIGFLFNAVIAAGYR